MHASFETAFREGHHSLSQCHRYKLSQQLWQLWALPGKGRGLCSARCKTSCPNKAALLSGKLPCWKLGMMEPWPSPFESKTNQTPILPERMTGDRHRSMGRQVWKNSGCWRVELQDLGSCVWRKKYAHDSILSTPDQECHVMSRPKNPA